MSATEAGESIEEAEQLIELLDVGVVVFNTSSSQKVESC